MKKVLYDINLIRNHFDRLPEETRQGLELCAAGAAIAITWLVGYYAGGFPFLP